MDLETTDDLPPRLQALQERVAAVVNLPAESLDRLHQLDFDLDRFLRKLCLVQEQGASDVTPETVFHDSSAIEPDTGKRRCLGDYELIRPIGQGGSATVFLARHQLLRREVAVKVLRTDMTSSTLETSKSKHKIALKRFRREMRVLAKLSHPNLVAVSDAREVDGEAILVMELIHGRTFRDLVAEQSPIPIDSAIEWIQGAARGLAFAHGVGLIHRDVKPTNLMLSDEGVVKVLDLGLVSLRMLEVDDDEDPSLTSPSCVMGTVDFISPEQIDDPRQANAASDIYSLGAVFYYLLVGQPPFCAIDYPSEVARLMAHASINPKPPSHLRGEVTPELDSIALGMLAKNPIDRFDNMHEVIGALQSIR